MGEILAKGLLDVILGMGIVFVLLIFLAAIIWALRFIPMLVDGFQKKEAKEDTSIPTTQKKTELSHQVENKEHLNKENLMEDNQLVAVITAAIMSSMGEDVPEDGLVIRSIKKVNKANWMKG